MKKLKFVCITALLATGIANAGPACNGFEIKLRNKLSFDFLVNKIDFQGAEVQPNGIQKLNANSEQVFTVNKSVEGKEMVGTFELHTLSLPTKKVTVKFNLNNRGLICQHDDKGSGGDESVTKLRLPGKVQYNIG